MNQDVRKTAGQSSESMNGSYPRAASLSAKQAHKLAACGWIERNEVSGGASWRSVDSPTASADSLTRCEAIDSSGWLLRRDQPRCNAGTPEKRRCCQALQHRRDSQRPSHWPSWNRTQVGREPPLIAVACRCEGDDPRSVCRSRCGR